MKFTEVEYGALRTVPGGFNNIKLSVKATLDKSEPAQLAIENLQGIVNKELDRIVAEPQLQSHDALIKEKTDELERLSQKIKKLNSILKDFEDRD